MNVPSEFQDKFDKMMVVGQLTKECLVRLQRFIEPGISTRDIDTFVRVFAKHHDLELAQLNYKGFPAACCTSVNHVICHGIPSVKKILKNGDIIKVDCTFIKDGYYGDSCRTYFVDDVKIKIFNLVNTTSESMWAGITQAKPGNTIRNISTAIQLCAEAKGFSVVRDFCGHGIGAFFHGPPSVPHYVDEHLGNWQAYNYELQPGDTFTIEPMINADKPNYKTLKDGWTVVTRDRGWSAQFEHTVGITNDGNVVFTL